MSADRMLCVRVADNGEGIAPENLTRIFAHGFTTRKEGHGFGLHSCANAAGEMGGKLTAHSDGPGTGATFTLELPIDATEEIQ
jgi:signal transduction histidine kinase